jgi:hypothetical protein
VGFFAGWWFRRPGAMLHVLSDMSQCMIALNTLFSLCVGVYYNGVCKIGYASLLVALLESVM